MSDRPIQVGDLVMVVRGAPCCNNPKYNGFIFNVKRLFYAPPNPCRYCGSSAEHGDCASSGKLGFFVSRLKRIPPLDELEGVDTQEKLREPA